MKGRKTTPENIRSLKGRIHTKREPVPKPRPMTEPLCPDLVSADPIAAQKWEETISLLREAETLQATDSDLLTEYCLEWSRFVGCVTFLNENGSTIVIRNDKGETKSVLTAPQESQRLKHLDRLLKMQIELGFTPTARTRVKPSTAKKTEPNPFEGFAK